MPAKSGVQARFDHIDDTGELVFLSETSAFHVSVDDRLERAILEARQVQQENSDAAGVHETKTLPISKIQALIRAGEEPGKVAERYDLSATLVRRFTSSVQTEKQDAIEQFLAVNAPKGSRMRTIGDLIESTLTAAKVDPQSVKWNATRRGREPWMICAQFQTPHNSVRAIWSWNIRDNGVECMNAASRILLGERVKPAPPQSDGEGSTRAPASSQDESNMRNPKTYDPLPPYRPYEQSSATTGTVSSQGDERLPMTSAPLTAPQDTDAQRMQRVVQMPYAFDQRESRTPMERTRHDASVGNSTTNGKTPNISHGATTDTRPPVNGQSANDAAGSPYDRQAAGNDAENGFNKTQGSLWGAVRDTEQSSQAPNPSLPRSIDGNEPSVQQHAKRKSGRSAMPSWDEIIFGD